MQNNVTVINKQASPLLYIVTLLLPKFYHFIQIPVADFKCPQQQTALVGFFVCKCYANPSLRDGQLQGEGEGVYTAEQLGRSSWGRGSWGQLRPKQTAGDPLLLQRLFHHDFVLISAL
jgi:hypothetical protein